MDWQIQLRHIRILSKLLQIRILDLFEELLKWIEVNHQFGFETRLIQKLGFIVLLNVTRLLPRMLARIKRSVGTIVGL